MWTSVRYTAHVLRSARTRRAAMSVFVPEVLSLLGSHMGQSVLLRVRKTHHSLGMFSLLSCWLHFHLCNDCTGNPPVLLLPDNVRIRRFNLSSQQYSDYVDNAEHIQALDYLWDPEGQGLSKMSTCMPLHWVELDYPNVFFPPLIPCRCGVLDSSGPGIWVWIYQTRLHDHL